MGNYLIQTMKQIKVHILLNFLFWMLLANAVMCSWSNRNLNFSRVGGVKIGAFDRSYKTNSTGRLGAGVKIGGKGTLKLKEILTEKEVTKPLFENKDSGNSFSHSNIANAKQKQEFKVFKLRLLLPYKSFGFREYNKATSSALNTLKRGSAKKLDFFRRYDIETQIETLTMTPSPISKYPSHFRTLVFIFNIKNWRIIIQLLLF